jgi:hypothetical protein
MESWKSHGFLFCKIKAFKSHGKLYFIEKSLNSHGKLLFETRVWNPIDFQGQRVKFVPHNILLNTLESRSFNGF